MFNLENKKHQQSLASSLEIKMLFPWGGKQIKFYLERTDSCETCTKQRPNVLFSTENNSNQYGHSAPSIRVKSSQSSSDLVYLPAAPNLKSSAADAYFSFLGEKKLPGCIAAMHQCQSWQSQGRTLLSQVLRFRCQQRVSECSLRHIKWLERLEWTSGKRWRHLWSWPFNRPTKPGNVW